MDRLNSYAGKALSGAGLPTSLENIPDWAAHFVGAADDSKPFWASAQEAYKNPTQENIVGAVPFIGPNAVSMSKDVKARNYGGALSTLAGTVASPFAAGEVRPGMQAGNAELANAVRTPRGKLTPLVREGSRVVAGGVGAGVGAGIGAVTGLPGLAYGGGAGGALLGPPIADAFLPNRAPIPDFHGGAYSDFAGESGKALPLKGSPGFDPYAYKSGAAVRTSAPNVFAPPAPPEPELGSPENPGFMSKLPARLPPSLRGDPFSPTPPAQQVAPGVEAPSPDVTRLPVPREPFPGENPNYAASIPRKDLLDLALQKKPGAGLQMQQTGKTVMYVPESYPAPRSSQVMDPFAPSATAEMPQGNPSPFSPPEEDLVTVPARLRRSPYSPASGIQ